MAKKTPIVITIRKGKHPSQPYTFTIDDIGGGPKVTVRERYTERKSARRAALRKLGVWNNAPGFPQATHHKGHPIKFVNA